MRLTSDHIAYIVQDLNYRGIVLDGFHDEVLDHICSAVETEMQTGARFIEAYQNVIRDFGYTPGLQEAQHQVLQTDNKTPQLMLKNYLQIALRNLSKQRFYTFINVSGLAIGVAACLIITLYILYEVSYDKHFANYERIHRINMEVKFGSTYYNQAVSSSPLAEALVRDYPEVVAATRLRQQGSFLVKRDKESFRENDVVYADSSFFNVFQIPFLEGHPAKALSEPNTAVISKRIADKYFPHQNAVGQTLTFLSFGDHKITGVIDNLPGNSHFQFDILVSMEGLAESKNGSWLSNNFHTYVLLREGADMKTLEAKFPRLFDTYVAPQAKAFLGGGELTLEKWEASGNVYRFYSTPLSDIHLRSALSVELRPNGDITYIYLFGAVALFILLIACINFMNLSTARSANRAKEVGIRKVLGSLRSHLVRQFMLESMLLSFVAFAVALGLAYLVLPLFNLLAARELAIPFSDFRFAFVLFFSAVIVGALAGVYPSFFLSAFKPVNVLKGKLALGMKSGVVRSGLVVLQFTISIFLIVGTIAIQRQLNFIQNKKIGFTKEQVVMIRNGNTLGNQVHAFKDEVLKDSRISGATISGSLPVAGTDRNTSSYWAGGTQPTDETMVGMQAFYVDHDYIKTLAMKVVDGRDFSRAFPSDSSAMILNQAATRIFGFEGDAIGKKIETYRLQKDNSVSRDQVARYTVVGVVEDFHFESMRENIGPLVLILSHSPGHISFRFNAGNTQAALAAIENQWRKLAPGQPFEYSFLDDAFGRMYASEQQLGKIFAIFAGLAIVIACLGLLALTAFTAEQRTKEIGIRKVLGASVGSIVMLLSKEFGKLIVIAFVLAAPASWYAVTWWLQQFTYKADIGLLVYALAGLCAFIIAWFTMGFQSIKAALTNPVTSLRSD